MNYFVNYQNQAYDPSSQAQGSYDPSTNNFYPYSYPYPNPQFSANINPYPHQNPIGQPSQHQEQEPNPPGVTPPPQPTAAPAELSGNSYYQYHAHGTAAGVPTVGTQPGPVVHHPIVQPLYGGVGNIVGTVPIGDPQIHLDPNRNAPSYPFHVSGHGRGHPLSMNAAVPFHDQTVIAHGGFHIQGGPSLLHSQSFGETHHGPRPKSSGRTSHVRGRGRGRGGGGGGGGGRGRGKGHVPRKHAAVPARDLQAKPDIPSQPIAESGASSSGDKIVPLQGPAPSVVLPPPKAVSCEICKIECNSVEILQQHLNGKKHKKKVKVLEELQNLNKKVITGQTEQETSGVELKSEVSPPQPDPVEVLPSQETNEETNVAAGEKRKAEDVEPPPRESSKKRRVMGLKRKGKIIKKKRGADGSKSSVEAPKAKEGAPVPLVCELCNVKCESVVVFQSHLVGKKHKAKAERFMGQQAFGVLQQ